MYKLLLNAKYLYLKKCQINEFFLKSSSELLRQFQPNLAQTILKWRGDMFLQKKDHAPLQGEIFLNSENTLTEFKILLL